MTLCGQWIGALLLICGAQLMAQLPEMEFEVAAVKASTADSPPMSIKQMPGHFTTSNTPLGFLIRWAYDIDEGRLIGGPKGLESVRYDIVAKIPQGEVAPGRTRKMMQSLLAERFSLRVHQESRQVSTYTLAVDKAGPKLQWVELGDGIGQNPFKMTDRGRLLGTRVTAEMLAKVLAGQIGYPVEDVTGLTRTFDFVLEWTPDDAVATNEAPPAAMGRQQRPSIYAALREQLGLRLVSRKTSVEVVVIDSVNTTPTDN